MQGFSVVTFYSTYLSWMKIANNKKGWNVEGKVRVFWLSKRCRPSAHCSWGHQSTLYGSGPSSHFLAISFDSNQSNLKCALHFSSQSLAITTFSSHEIAQSWRCIHLSFILGGGEIGFGCQLKYGLTQFKEVLNSFSTGHSPSYFLQMPLKKITITLLQILCAIECSSRWYQIRNRYVWCILMSLPR